MWDASSHYKLKARWSLITFGTAVPAPADPLEHEYRCYLCAGA